jgi:hypothetical protein
LRSGPIGRSLQGGIVGVIADPLLLFLILDVVERLFKVGVAVCLHDRDGVSGLELNNVDEEALGV